MKKKLHLSLAIGLLLTVTAVQAQIKFGAKLGLNFPTMTLDFGSDKNTPKTMIGYHLGAVAEFPLESYYVLQPGILLTTKGDKRNVSRYQSTISTTYIEIPINVLYKIDLKVAKLFMFAGPYVAFGISGEKKYASWKDDIKWGSKVDCDFKRVDYGVNIGAGIEVENIQIMVQYNVGLTNLSTKVERPAGTNYISASTEYGYDIQNRGIGISATFLFDNY